MWSSAIKETGGAGLCDLLPQTLARFCQERSKTLKDKKKKGAKINPEEVALTFPNRSPSPLYERNQTPRITPIIRCSQYCYILLHGEF